MCNPTYVAVFMKTASASSLGALAALALLPLSLTQCVVVDDTNTPSAENSSRSGYSLGLEKGREDGRGGLSRNPDRYSYLYAESNRSEYFRGYEDGYNQGIR